MKKISEVSQSLYACVSKIIRAGHDTNKSLASFLNGNCDNNPILELALSSIDNAILAMEAESIDIDGNLHVFFGFDDKMEHRYMSKETKYLDLFMTLLYLRKNRNIESSMKDNIISMFSRYFNASYMSDDKPKMDKYIDDVSAIGFSCADFASILTEEIKYRERYLCFFETKRNPK